MNLPEHEKLQLIQPRTATMAKWTTKLPMDPGWYWWRPVADTIEGLRMLTRVEPGSGPPYMIFGIYDRQRGTNAEGVQGEWWPVRIKSPQTVEDSKS